MNDVNELWIYLDLAKVRHVKETKGTTCQSQAWNLEFEILSFVHHHLHESLYEIKISSGKMKCGIFCSWLEKGVDRIVDYDL